MKRRVWASAVALLAVSLTLMGQTAPRFDQKLLPEKQILHAVNRLTFGARATDVVEVRRLGVDAWIDLQLRPEKVSENPVLEARLKPLETLGLPSWQIMEKYGTPPGLVVVNRPVAILNLLSPLQRAKLTGGAPAEERKAVLVSFDADVRRQLLLTIPVQALDGLPEFQDEAQKARQAETAARQAESRRLNPPLNELIAQDQIRILRTAPDQEKIALLETFDAEKRRQVMRGMGLQAFQNIPQLRREAMAAGQPQQVANSELTEAKLLRAVYSNRQLEEVLVDFWTNHFNVFNGKGQIRMWLTSYERDAIRPHVFGRFRDMLLATARHPAMLLYLDNNLSQAPREDLVTPVSANGTPTRLPGLNENYGREIMELHTLGVGGGYTQEDVLAVARAFTGWTIFDQAKYAEFMFNPANHDRKEKVVLEHTLPAGRGEQDGLDVIDILASHPSTAKFISKKLAQRFVADNPPQALIDRMATTFTKTDGDLRAVLKTLFSSVEFSSEAAWQAKMKSPLELTVSAVRALNADVADGFVLAQRIAELGQPLYAKVEPTGYPNTGESWASTAGLLGRINFATTLAGNQISGVKVDMSRFNFKAPAVVAREMLGTAPPPSMLASIEKGIQGKEASPSMLVTIILSSPEFQRR